MVQGVKASFVERLITSRLLSEQQLTSVLEAVGEDEARMAEYMLEKNLLTSFQVRQLRAGASSFSLGNYVVVDCLGRGGNGVVYKARHVLMPNRFVALKTLDSQSLHHTDESLARFKREIEIVARLEHPNIVRAYDVLQTRTQLYLVLEYVPGQDLATLVKERGPLAVATAVDYAVQTARGLAYAHQCGIVHRDLKPANLLLTLDGIVKLTDLGLARMLEETDGDASVQGRCLGTPEFMAPEQAEDASKADCRSDLYALGSTLFHLLTGELPIKSNSYLQALQQLLLVPPRPLAQARPDVPAGLAAIVDRLRSRDPAERPASAAEALTLLEPFALRPSEARLWTGRRKAHLIIDVLQGRRNAEDVCASCGIETTEFETWRLRFLEAGEQALNEDAISREQQRIELLRELHAQIGAQAMEIQRLRKRLGDN